MAAPTGRLRHTHVTTTNGFLLDSLDRTCFLHDIKVTYENVTVDGRGVCSAWSKAVPVKSRATMDFQLRDKYVNTSPAAVAINRNLDITAFDLLNYSGTSDYTLLTSLQSGSITVTNNTVDGSGIASRWEEPNITGSELELKGSFVIDINDTTAANAWKVMGNAMNNPLTWTGNDAIAYHTMGGNVVLGNNTYAWADNSLVLGSIEYGIAVEDLQKVDISLKSMGAPQATMANFIVATSGFTVDAIIDTIFSGDALLTIVLDQNITSNTGLELSSTLDHWVVTSCTVDFSNSQINNISVSAACTGDPNGS